jgi:hypothetical protein
LLLFYRDDEECTLQNPTYELGGSGALAAKPVTTRHANNPPNHQVYEDMDEALEPTEEFTPMPYAIHDFGEDGTSCSVDMKAESNVVLVGPTVPTKPNFARPKKKKGKEKNLDIRRSLSESATKPIAAAKPPIAQRTGILKKPALKPALQPLRTLSVSESAVPPHGAYSELNQKSSYATLEPHIGGGLEDTSTAEQNSKESYCHLNH